jgi:tetratricopeptide (TPR) repeat protein
VFILLTLVLSIAGGYIYLWLKGKELLIFEELIEKCRLYWKFFASALAITSVICFYGWIKEKQAEFRRIWEFYKPAKRLTPKDFKIQRYKKAYILRKSNTAIEDLLKNEEHILIIGKPMIGKTRTAFEEIKKLEKFSVIKPKPENIEGIEKVIIPPLSNKNFILFLDELNYFIDKNVEDLVDRLRKKSKKLLMVATCRTGEELDLVKEELLSLYRKFKIIHLEELSQDDCKKLAENIKKEDKNIEWKPEQFDGTPGGSVTLDLKDMEERYKKAGNGKVILKSLKLLREAGLFLYKEVRIKDICKDIFELPTERYIWEEIINNLKGNGFITTDRDIIDIYPSYLDFCVSNYDPSLNDLMKLKNILIRKLDSRDLLYFGNGFYYKKDFTHAKDCYLEALKIYPEYTSAHNSLGYVLTKLGEAEEAKGRYVEAERLYKEAKEEHKKAIRINPYYASAHNSLGYVLTRLGEIKGEYGEAKRLFEEAMEEHRRAIELKPEYVPAHHSLAYVLGILEINEEAEKEHREAIRLNPESPFAHNLLGHLLVKLERNGEAEKEYREAIRIKPEYPSVHNNFGHLLVKLGRYKEAKKEYKEAIKISPDYIVAYVNLGHLLVNCEKYEEAEKAYRKAIDINPNYAEARNALGYALVNLERYDEAEKEYRKAIEIQSNYVEAHMNLGYLLVLLGKLGKDEDKKEKYDEAEKEYRKALQINPDDEEVLICLGILLEKLDRDKEAEICYKKVIRKNPYNMKARTTYIYFLSSRGREEEVKNESDEIIKITPKDAKMHNQLIYFNKELLHIHINRVRALIKSSRFDEAENEIEKAIRLDQNNALVNKTFGILKEELGDRAQDEENKSKIYKEAEKEYRKALDINLLYPSAHRHLANLLAKLGRYKEAESEYEETKKVASDYPKNNRDFGIFLSKTKRKKDASKELEIAIKLFKDRGEEEYAKKTEELLKNL